MEAGALADAAVVAGCSGSRDAAPPDAGPPKPPSKAAGAGGRESKVLARHTTNMKGGPA